MSAPSEIETSLVVLAKAPVPGRVKTRLCPPCTPGEAARVAEAALVDTLRAIAGTPAFRRAVVLDGEPGPWVPPGMEVVEQASGGLDERLAAACDVVRGSVLLIGMDTPQVSRTVLGTAIERLHRPGVDAVLGMAEDGGWWAIGLRRPDPRVFLKVPMSTSHTGEAQANRLHALGLASMALPRLRDVDRFDDAVAVARSIPRSRFARVVATVAARVQMRQPDGTVVPAAASAGAPA